MKLLIIALVLLSACTEPKIGSTCTTCTESKTKTTASYCGTQDEVEFYKSEIKKQGNSAAQTWNCVDK